MPVYQLRNADLDGLRGVDERTYPRLTEPLGGMGVWNGSFEQGPDGQYPGIENWTATPSAGSTIARYSADQYDGLYCVRAASVGGLAPGYLNCDRYLPVSEGIVYYADCATRGSAAGTTLQFRMNCYTANKTYISTVNIVSGAIGVNWVWRQSQVGPGGGAIIPFAANTRWIRLDFYFNYAAAASWAEVDAVAFGMVM